MTKLCTNCKSQYMIRKIDHYVCVTCEAMERITCEVKPKTYEHFGWCVTDVREVFDEESKAIKAAKYIGGNAIHFEVFK